MFKSTIININKKMNDGSMDSYHLKGLFYCVSPFIFIGIFLAELKVLSFIINLNLNNRVLIVLLILLELLLLILFFMTSFCITRYFFKELLSNFKKKDILYSLMVLYLFLVTSIITLEWFHVFFSEVLNLCAVLLKESSLLVFSYKNIGMILQLLSISMSNMMVIYIPLALSYFLNLILPDSLQQKNVPIKRKIFRGLLKIGACILLFIVSILFSVIDKNNFSSITVFTTLFTFMCTPKVILRLFSNYKNVENLKISSEISRTFDLYKLFYYEFIFSWSVSIYFFDSKTPATKANIFIITLFIFLILTVIFKWIASNPNNKFFSRWIVPYNNKYRCKSFKNYRKPR